MDEKVTRSAPAPEGTTASKGASARPRRRGWGRLLLLVILLGAGFVAWQRLHDNQPARPRGRSGQPPQAVGAASAVLGDMPLTLNALGTVTSLDTVSVQTQVAGRLTQIGFKQGSMVKAGDFLAQIDPRPYQASLEQAQATLAKDTATLAQARSDLTRYQTLIRQDSISKQQVQDQQFLVQQDEAAIKVDQANVDTAQLNVSFARIVSPITGLAGLQQVDVGNYLQPASATPIVMLTQIEPISVVFAIPAQSLPQVRARLRAGATLPVTALDQTDAHILATGTLAATDSQINTTTGTINLKAVFANGEDVLFPNQFVNVRLLVDTQTGVTLAPNAAIQRGAPGTFVYVVGADGAVSVQPVTIGASDATRTVIVSGLKPGQSVVTDGADRLSDGAKVIVRNTPPAVAAGAGAGAPGLRAGARGAAGAGRRGAAGAGRRGRGSGGPAPGAAPDPAPGASPSPGP